MKFPDRSLVRALMWMSVGTIFESYFFGTRKEIMKMIRRGGLRIVHGTILLLGSISILFPTMCTTIILSRPQWIFSSSCVLVPILIFRLVCSRIRIMLGMVQLKPPIFSVSFYTISVVGCNIDDITDTTSIGSYHKFLVAAYLRM